MNHSILGLGALQTERLANPTHFLVFFITKLFLPLYQSLMSLSTRLTPATIRLFVHFIYFGWE